VPLSREVRALFAETAADSSDLDISAIVNGYSRPDRAAQKAEPLRRAR
jgi:hypothetical protein